MKKSENGNEAKASTNTINVREDVVSILKSVLLTRERYGSAYLLKILQGTPETTVKKEEHLNLETFGCMNERSAGEVRDLINWMIREGYLFVIQGQYPVIKAGKKGKEFLDNPVDLWVRPGALKLSKRNTKLLMALRELRNQIATEKGVDPYTIFNDFTLYQMAVEKPKDGESFVSITGVGPYKSDEYGRRFMDRITRFVAENPAVRDLEKEVQTATVQDARALFQKGLSLNQIAEQKQVSVGTVSQYLEKLHLAGQINMKPWIEQHVDKKSLFRGVQYFKSAENAKLKVANEVLGLDYETLRFCRIYADKATAPPATNVQA